MIVFDSKAHGALSNWCRMNKALAYAAFGVTTCLTLLGCAAPKQTFVDPITDTPAAWTSVLPTKELQDASRYPWWQALGNPTLDALVNQALAQNTSVARSAKAVEIANQQLNTVKLGWLPSLTLFGGRITGNTTLFFQGLPVPLSDVGNFVGILPNYFVNLFRLPYEQRQAMELVDVARAEMLAVRLAIIGEVVSAYALALSAERELALLAEFEARIDRQERLLTDLQSVGMASQSMVNQVKAQKLGVQGQRALAQANAVAARNALNTLVRNPLGTSLASDSLENLSVSERIAQQTPAAVLNTRPDIVAQRARVLAATTGIDVQTMLLAPTLDFNALRTNINTQTNSLGASSNANFTAGYATLALEPRIFGLIQTSQLQAQDALLQYVQTVDRAIADVDDAIAALGAQLLNLQALTEQVDTLEASVRDLRALEQAQLTSELRVLEAEIETIAAKMSLTQAKAQTTLAYAALQQAMGIGVLYDTENLALKNGLIEKRSDEKVH